MSKGKIHITVVLNGDGLSTKGLSGGAIRMYEVMRNWSQTGKASIHIVTTSGGLHKLSFNRLSFPTTLLKASVFGKREHFIGYRVVSYLISALDFRRKERQVPSSEVVISSSDFFCDTEVASYMKRKRKNVFWTAMIYHLYTEPSKRPGNPIVNWAGYLLQQFSLKKIVRQADIALVLNTEEGDRVKNHLEKLGMAPTKIYSVNCGVDIPRFSKNISYSQKEYTAIFVGELRPNKGIFDLVPIWKEVCQHSPQARLLVVGDGGKPYYDRLVSEIRHENLEQQITLAGSLSMDNIVKAYHSAQIMIAPSHEEGWGIAMLEGMASGLPIIAYDLSTYRRHYSGAFVPVTCFNCREFAEKIGLLLSDKQRAKELSEIGLNRAAKFNWSAISEQDLEIILNSRVAQ